MAPVRFAPEALADLEEIRAFIARDNPNAALSWIEKLTDRAERASFAPRSGRVVPEIGNPDVREVFLRTYRIIYRVERHGILVITVIEGHRLLRR